MPDGAHPAIRPGLSYGFARQNGIVLLTGADGVLDCACKAGVSLETLLEAQRVSGTVFQMREVSTSDFDRLIGQVYRDSASEASAAADAADDDLAALADSAAEVDDLLDQQDDAPVVRLINALLLEAVKEGASDIHIETAEKRVSVRFRVDGVLREMIEPKRSLAPLLVSRIKVMARLDIAEKRLPQDGRVSLRVGGHEVDVRVSTIPSQYGERVVMRLLNRDSARLDLEDLGMTPGDLARFRRILARPDGVMLVTGPTGSGKTTTLYSALNTLRDGDLNIMTIEDPIEYALDGTAQIQVNPRTGMTFARGLRAIMRQDPDVIMVGEIRDGETAQVAVQASMTGNLVISTLHTNTAIGSISRLIDMGAERFLLAPVLSGLVAQRLVRRLCEVCRKAEKATALDRDLLGGELNVGDIVYRAEGCDACHGQGYRGRTAVYEVVAVDPELEAMIHAGATEAELTAAARRAGPSLLQDAVARVHEGVTSVKEAARVVQDDGAIRDDGATRDDRAVPGDALAQAD